MENKENNIQFTSSKELYSEKDNIKENIKNTNIGLEINNDNIEKFNKNFDNNNLIYYKHLKYCNKKFYILSNNNQIKNNDHIVYYCNNHNTYKYSNIINSKGTKKNNFNLQR